MLIRINKRGQGLVEYALIIAILSALMFFWSIGLKGGITGVFNNAVKAL